MLELPPRKKVVLKGSKAMDAIYTLPYTTPECGLPIITRSWGIKSNTPVPALREVNFLVDARAIYEPRGISGADPAAQAIISAQNDIYSIYSYVRQAINCVPTRRKDLPKDEMFKKPFIILFMCAYGVNRSPALKHLISRMLKEEGFNVTIE